MNDSYDLWSHRWQEIERKATPAFYGRGDISEEDARAEGCEAIGITFQDGAEGRPHLVQSLGSPYRDGFRILWESINGPGSWDSNPWVWTISFKRAEAA